MGISRSAFGLDGLVAKREYLTFGVTTCSSSLFTASDSLSRSCCGATSKRVGFTSPAVALLDCFDRPSR